MSAVSALLPVLPQADVLRLMDCLETHVGSGTTDIPLSAHLADDSRDAAGGHHDRVAHPKPCLAAAGDARRHVKRSSRGRSGLLEEQLGDPIDHFAYPGGQFTPSVVERAARRGLSICLHRVSARRSEASGADARAPAAVGRLVDRRRRCSSRRPFSTARFTISGRPRGDASGRITYEPIYRATPFRSPRFCSSPAGRSGSRRRSSSPCSWYACSTRPSSAPTSSCSLFTARCTASRSSAWPRASTTSSRASRRKRDRTSRIRWSRWPLRALGCLGLLWFAEDRIASWLSNPQLADHVVLLGAFLMLMLMSAAFEIVMVARKQHLTAAWTYGASDVARTILLVIPAFVHGGLRGVLWGGVAFGAVRVMAMLPLAAARIRRRPAAEPQALEVPAGIRAPVCARRRHRSAPGEPSLTTSWHRGSTRRRLPSTRSGACRFHSSISSPPRRRTS